MDVSVIILAAGKGVRMKSDLPKVFHSICGKPMVCWVIESVQKAKFNNIYVIVGYKAELVRGACEKYGVKSAEQKEQLGTGHAVAQVQPFLKDHDGVTIVLNGDVPFIRPETLKDLVDFHKKHKASATILTADLEDPGSYGRIIRDKNGRVTKIVEKKDAKEAEIAVKEINSGTYCFNNKQLFDVLPKLKSTNAQNEYYLTDVVEILKNSGSPVYAYKVPREIEILGVNTKEDLVRMEDLCKNELHSV